MKPATDRIVLRPLRKAEGNECQGLVIAIARGSAADGEGAGWGLGIGDRVSYAANAGTIYQLADRPYVVISADDVIALLEAVQPKP